MREIPDCLNRRYRALDDLIKELNSVSNIDLNDDTSGSSTNDPGIKLMCEFWNILKEDPECNLTQEVQERMGVTAPRGLFRPQRVSCYMAAHNCSKKDEDKKSPDSGKPKNVCCHKDPAPKSKCCASKSVTPSSGGSDVLPLSKVLCNLKEAASFDRRCQGMVSELMATQKQLQDQIQHLEHREKEGIQLLKQADCMWACMEEAYKKKIQESQERQKELLKELKEAEASTNKWRKNKKDLEFQLANIATCQREITEKINQKQNDIKCMNADIADYKKRIENNKKELEAAKKSLGTKKQTSDDKIRKLVADISRKEKVIKDENNIKAEKEREGNEYIREAREDLQKLSRVLLQKKIENEDMRAEKEALIEELELISETYDQCKDKCQAKKQSIEDEIKIIDKEIANYKVRCIRCHQCTDTVDIRKFCTDCPRCIEERDCLYQDDHCNPDHSMDCMCMAVKQKFLDNVFDNMYTVLERQIKTGPGKAVAEAVLSCLKRSRNGKLDPETRQMLQDFILTTVKKNLNLTIVGGAVKTRCELDSDTYKQLMLCLKQVKVTRPPKADKETAAKKEPCPRWGVSSECNCPKGPKACVCTKRAPAPPQEPGPCPPPDKEDAGEIKICPYKESAACGPDCAMHAVPSAVGTDVAAWRPDACQAPTCQFKNMRAAQCVLGPEALTTLSGSKSYVTAVPYVPNIRILDDQDTCKCKPTTPMKTCSCDKDGRHHPRERIIEEVMGKYFEVTPIDKVSSAFGSGVSEIKDIQKNDEVCVCLNIPLKKCTNQNIYSNTSSLLFPDLYDNDMHIIDDDKIIINREGMFNADNYVMIEVNSGLSLKSININKCEADLEEKATSLHTNIVHTAYETSEPVNGNGYAANISDFILDEKSYKDISNPLFQRKVCNLAQRLIKDVIVFDDKPKVDDSQEWITTETFINEILDKTKERNINDSNITNKEIEIKVESLEYDEMKSDYKNTTKDNTKQMKVETRTPCSKETCKLLFKSVDDDKSFQTIQESFINSSLGKLQDFEGNTINSFKQKRFLPTVDRTTSDKFTDEDKNYVDPRVKEDLINDQFRPILENKDDFKSVYTELPDDRPKPLEIDINEQLIDLIDTITKEDSAFVSLKKTESGHLTLGLNSITDDKNGESILIRKSPSGNMIIEVDEKKIQSLKSNRNESNSGSHFDDPKEKSVNDSNVPGICTPQCSKNKILTQNAVKKFLLRNSKENFSACTKKLPKEIILKDHLQKLYDIGQRKLKVRIKYKNEELIHGQALLTQTPSGNIIINITNSVDTQNTEFNCEEFPVSVIKTVSGTLEISYIDSVIAPHWLLKQTATGSNLLYIEREDLQKTNIKRYTEKKEDIFKVKIKGLDNITPTLIKPTSSGNYIVVLDKEFEKFYTKSITDQFTDDNESYFELNQTNSGIELDFSKHNGFTSNSKKALLLKSFSGMLKIVVSDNSCSEQEKVTAKKRSNASGSFVSAKAIDNLLKKLPSPSRKPKQCCLNKKRATTTKSISDSNLPGSAKSNLQNSQNILDKPSTTLKRTVSGQYAVVLDKESKKSFINNLITYFDKTSKGVMPVKRTESGELTIVFDKTAGNQGENASLKITSSGNIYVILDESSVNKMSNNVAINTRSVSSKVKTSPYITKVENPENKAISTSCNASPNDDSCDFSKCVCKDLYNREDSFSHSDSLETPNVSHRVCNKSKCPKAVCNKQTIKSNNKSPHIVIRPCNSRPVPDKGNKFQESYYCAVQSICPYHKGRYEAVSNELLEISGLCNKSQEKKPVSKVKTDMKIRPAKTKKIPKSKVKSDWDSFDYLPPQLPPFLRDASFR